MDNCCFLSVSLFAFTLKVCSNKNDNDPSGSLLWLSLKASLEAWDMYPMASLTVAATSLFFDPWKISACLTTLAKATKTGMSLPTAQSVQKDIASNSNWLQELTPLIPSVNPLGFGFVHVFVGPGSDWITKQRKELITLGNRDSRKYGCIWVGKIWVSKFSILPSSRCEYLDNISGTTLDERRTIVNAVSPSYQWAGLPVVFGVSFLRRVSYGWLLGEGLRDLWSNRISVVMPPMDRRHSSSSSVSSKISIQINISSAYNSNRLICDRPQ